MERFAVGDESELGIISDANLYSDSPDRRPEYEAYHRVLAGIEDEPNERGAAEKAETSGPITPPSPET